MPPALRPALRRVLLPEAPLFLLGVAAIVVEPVRTGLGGIPFVGTASGLVVMLVGLITGRARTAALGALLAAVPPTFAHVAFDPPAQAVGALTLLANLAIITALRPGVPLPRIVMWGAALVAVEYTAIVTAVAPDSDLARLAAWEFLGGLGSIVPVPDLAAAGGLVLMVAAAVHGAVFRDPLGRGVAWITPLFLVGAIPESAPAATVAASLVMVGTLVAGAHALAYRDALTGLPGRRAFDEALAVARAPFVVAVVDVDHFKRVNDTHGHDVGDQVLRMVAKHLGGVRGGRAYRIGGEEFAILFAGTTGDEAGVRLDEVRTQVEGTPFGLRGANRPKERPKAPRPRPSTRHLAVTISIGVAEAAERPATPSTILQAADRALYRAKESGRNRVLPARARDYQSPD